MMSIGSIIGGLSAVIIVGIMFVFEIRRKPPE